MRILTISLLICLVFISIFDIYSTVIILDNGGTEVNPVMNFFMNLIGVVPSLLLTKILALTAAFILAFKCKSKELPFYSTLLIIVNIFYVHMLYTNNYYYLKIIQ